MIVYGIPSCNSVKKAIDWLKAHNLVFEFHDYKKLGITDAKLKEWSSLVTWQVLVNKKGTTWRGLDADTQESITNAKNAVALMKLNTSLIKRPVIETKNGLLVGFDEQTYSEKLIAQK